jgi:hypothetical protein
MATRKATRRSSPPRTPERGAAYDASVYTAAAVPVADVIEFAQIEAGMTLIGIELIHDALGATTTVTVDDGTTTFFNAANTAAAGRVQYTGFPKKYTERTTIKGTVAGAAITGKVGVILRLSPEDHVLA